MSLIYFDRHTINNRKESPQSKTLILPQSEPLNLLKILEYFRFLNCSFISWKIHSIVNLNAKVGTFIGVFPLNRFS